MGQICLKFGVDRLGGIYLNNSILSELLRIIKEPVLILAITFYGVAFYLGLVALSKVGLSVFYLFTSASYVIILLAAYLIFDEPISYMKIIGCIFIMLGVNFVMR